MWVVGLLTLCALWTLSTYLLTSQQVATTAAAAPSLGNSWFSLVLETAFPGLLRKRTEAIVSATCVYRALDFRERVNVWEEFAFSLGARARAL